MSVGRPVIINSEIGIAKWVAENKLGWLCPYDDVAALEKILNSLCEHRANLPEFAKNARKILLQGYTWDTMASRLTNMYQQLDDVSS
jgi:glycosyltransferase involved in cell wall biosynthesis